MKKIVFTLFICIVSFFTLHAQYTFEWSAQFKGENVDHAYGMAIDNEGNVITCGEFYFPIDFDPSDTDEAIFTSVGPPNGFICKLDADGNYMWARTVIGGNCKVLDVATDDEGNVYACGWFRNTVDFVAGEEQWLLSSTGKTDMFLAKYSSSGEFQWAFSAGNIENDTMNAVAIDNDGNIVVSGSFAETVDFDPSKNIETLFEISGNGSWDAFVAKYDSDGNYIWARQFMGENLQDAFTLAVTSTNDIVVGGYFTNNIDCDPSDEFLILEGTGSIPNWDCFIIKLTDAGNLVWAKSFGGVGEDQLFGIAVDEQDNVYSTGSFRQTVDFNPGDGVFEMITPLGLSDPFILKLNSEGDFVWAKAFVGGETGIGSAISVLGGMIYSTGYATGACDFDPGDDVVELTDKGSSDIYISVLDADGNYQWAYRTGGYENDYGRAIAVDNEHLYISGDFRHNSVYFGNEFYSSEAFEDVYVAKINHPTGVLVKEFSDEVFSIYPNPSTNNIFISGIRSNADVKVFDASGKMVLNQRLVNNGQLNISHLEAGVYTITIETTDAKETKKIMVVR